MSSLVWKRGDGWVQHDPPKGHPCYKEWLELKMKQAEKNA